MPGAGNLAIPYAIPRAAVSRAADGMASADILAGRRAFVQRNDKGTAHAIEVARRAGRRLVIAGIIQDERYFQEMVAPHKEAHESTVNVTVWPGPSPL